LAILGFVGEIYFEDKVVAHYKNGRIVKGHAKEFDPGSESFVLQPYAAEQQPVSVPFEELKAVFHVRTFEGNPEHGPSPDQVGEVVEPRFRAVMSKAKRALLEFADGERMWGFAEGIERGDPGFFFFPTDPGGNNLRIYVVRSALKDLVLLDRN